MRQPKTSIILRKGRSAAAVLSFFFFFLGAARGETKLDIGSEYRLRSIFYSNPTYASEITPGETRPLGITSTNHNYLSHRGRLYLKARFDPGIEIATQLQAIGVQGSTGPLIGRYPNEDFTPFVENIYIRANEIYDLPISVALGRIPYVWGSGLLISDDGLGFDGIRVDAGPFWGIRTHLFTAKAKERIEKGDHDLHLAGISYAWGIHNIRLGWVLDQDESGSNYTLLGTSVPVPFQTNKISRQYYDLQVDGRLEKGAFYNFEFAMQSGNVISSTSTAPHGNIGISGAALTFDGGFDFRHPRWGRMLLAFVFMQGSGDLLSTPTGDEKFNVNFGHRFDGLERVGAGEFFAATPYSFFNEDKVQVIAPSSNLDRSLWPSAPYTALFSGLRTFGFRGSVTPIDPLTAGLEFYIFTARETPKKDDTTGKGSAFTENDNELGRELVITAQYTYAKRVVLGLKWGKFFPSKNLNDIGSSRLLFEAKARF